MARDERQHDERTSSCRRVLRVAWSVAWSAERRNVLRVEHHAKRHVERRVERRVELLRSDFPLRGDSSSLELSLGQPRTRNAKNFRAMVELPKAVPIGVWL